MTDKRSTRTSHPKPMPRLGKVLIARLRREKRRKGLRRFIELGLMKREPIAIDGMIVRRYTPTDRLYQDGKPGRQLELLQLAIRAPSHLQELLSPEPQTDWRIGCDVEDLDDAVVKMMAEQEAVSATLDSLEDRIDKGSSPRSRRWSSIDDDDDDDNEEEASPIAAQDRMGTELALPSGSFSELSPSAYRQMRKRLLHWMRRLLDQPLPSEIAACLLLGAGLEKLPRLEFRRLMHQQDAWVLLVGQQPSFSYVARVLGQRDLYLTAARIGRDHSHHSGVSDEPVPIAIHGTSEVISRRPRGTPIRGRNGFGDGLHLIITSRPEDLPVEMAGVIDHVIEAPRLTPSILGHVIAQSTGSRIEEAQKAVRAAMMRTGLALQKLKITDLDYAIRSERTLEEIMAALHLIALERSEADPNTIQCDDGSNALRAFLDLRRASGPAGKEALRIVERVARSKKGNDNAGSGSIVFLPERASREGPDRNSFVGLHRLSEAQMREALSAGARTVDDLPGLGEAGEWASDLKRDVASWRDGEIDWKDVSSRMLLSGPPGCGKTSFARALANSLDLPVFATSVSTWLQPGYLGDVLTLMDRVFDDVVRAGPAVLFIDEIDGLGTRQDANRPWSSYHNALINKALELLDGAVAQTGLIVIGATNHPGMLDPALVRSGRLDQHVSIPLPDRKALADIARHYIGGDLEAVTGSAVKAGRVASAGKPKRSRPEDGTASKAIGVDETVLDRLAILASGQTGADVERAIRDARREARRTDRPLDFETIERHLGGGDLSYPDEIAWQAAVHEAGHAVAVDRLEFGALHHLSMTSKGAATSIAPSSPQRLEDLLDWLTVLMAGREAEKLVFGDCLLGSGGIRESDLARATEIATSLETRLGSGGQMPLLYRDDRATTALVETDQALAQRVSKRLDDAAQRARTLLEPRKAMIEQLAEALKAARVLSGEEAKAIMRRPV